MGIPRVVIAGTHSGVGKTTIAVGLMATLRRRHLIVQPFKVGPDYIDPSHHTVATGRPSRNLDSWMVPKDSLLELFHRASWDAGVAVVEGVMGLFDGHSGKEETGSTAEVAKLLDAPVVVVLDAARMARSAAAMAFGYARFDPDLRVVGFLLNDIGSERHFEMVKEAIEGSGTGKVFGYLPRDKSLDLPERHLGLVPTGEEAPPPDYLDRLVSLIESHVDVEGLLEAISHHSSPNTQHPTQSSVLSPQSLFPAAPLPRCAVIAVARDEAFNFYYQDNLDLLEAHGAELVFFSPMRDASLPRGTQALYVGGGFPEMHAAALARNESMLASIRRAIAGGMPAYAECGGLMYLSHGIVNEEGVRYPMVGAVPGWCSMVGKRLRMGYVEVRSRVSTPLGSSGLSARGHEFHYSLWDGEDASAAAYAVVSHSGRPEGFARGNLLASFVHLHFGTNPSLAPAFVGSASRYR